MRTNLDDFDIWVSPSTPHGHPVHFDLNITAANGGPWSASFDMLILCGTGDHQVFLPGVFKQFTPPFDSQFNGSAPGWEPHSGSWWIDSGAWYTTRGISGSSASTSYVTNYANFDYEARLWRSGCEGCANRLLVRGTPYPLASNNWWYAQYAFQYTRNGSFSVWKQVAGASSALQGWTDSPAINQGGDWNVLRVVANGPNLYFYINGTLVWLGSDASLSSGRVGIGMYRASGTTDNQLWADWATLTPLVTSAIVDQVSPEQQALNQAANQRGGGNMDYAHPKE